MFTSGVRLRYTPRHGSPKFSSSETRCLLWEDPQENLGLRWRFCDRRTMMESISYSFFGLWPLWSFLSQLCPENCRNRPLSSWRAQWSAERFRCYMQCWKGNEVPVSKLLIWTAPQVLILKHDYKFLDIREQQESAQVRTRTFSTVNFFCGDIGT